MPSAVPVEVTAPVVVIVSGVSVARRVTGPLILVLIVLPGEESPADVTAAGVSGTAGVIGTGDAGGASNADDGNGGGFADDAGATADAGSFGFGGGAGGEGRMDGIVRSITASG